MEGFRVVSGQGDDKEGANTINVRIWVDSAVLEYESLCVAKPPGEKFDYVLECRGGAWMPTRKKNCVGNIMRETFEGGLCKEGC